MSFALTKVSAPTVSINGVIVPIVPNTLSYVEGQGTPTVRVQSGGGRATQNVVAENVDTYKGRVMFEVESTVINIENSRGWKTNNPNNTVRVSSVTDGFSRVFRNATMINDPEKNLSADGTISIEFESLPAA